MPSRTITIENPSDVEVPTIEITIHKNKFFVAGLHERPNVSETDFTTNLENYLQNKYEKLILMGDFNMTASNPVLSQFLDTFALPPLNIDRTCFKN